MKKFLIILLILGLVLSLFVGCTSKDEAMDEEKPAGDTKKDEPKKEEEVKDEEPAGPVPGLYPIPGNPIISYWVGLSSNTAPNYEEFGVTPFYKQVMEDTGVTIEFNHPPAGQDKEQLNLMIASNDVTDVMEYNWVGAYPGGPAKALMDGFMVDLTDMIPTYAPALYKYYQGLPEVERMVKTDEGQYYCFPFLRDITVSEQLLVFFGPMVRQNFLDELDMDIPVTMSDWYDMLTAFKNELDIASPLTYQWGFMNTGMDFVSAYGIINDFYMEDGKVTFGPTDPRFKDFLTEYSKWYAEGLIDQDITTIDRKQSTAKITGGQAGAALGYTASRLGSWMQSMRQEDPTYTLTAVKHPVLNVGDKPMYGQKDFPYPGGSSAAITTSSEDPETVAIFLDYAYSEQGHLLYNFGIEGVSYEWIDGYPTFTDLIIANPDGWPVNEAMGGYNRANSAAPMIQDVRYFVDNYVKMPEQLVSTERWGDSDVVKYKLPPITPTPEESEEFATIMNEINTYKDEMFVKFLLGQTSVDNFDEYVQNIENMGLARAIELKQLALDRFNAR